MTTVIRYPADGEFPRNEWTRIDDGWRGAVCVATTPTSFESVEVAVRQDHAIDGWMARTYYRGAMIYSAEHESRDHAMRYSGQAAMRALRMRFPNISQDRPVYAPEQDGAT